MKRLMMTTAAMFFTATMASAAVGNAELIAAFQAQGYTRIEVVNGVSQIKVEAVKGNQKIEVIYDAATGAILSQESYRAGKRDQGTGVEVKSDDRNFVSDGASGDDSDDSNDASDDSNHNSSGHGSDHDNGKDEDDDHGRGHGRGHDNSSGSDDDVDDDHGDDHSGSNSGSDHDGDRGSKRDKSDKDD